MRLCRHFKDCGGCSYQDIPYREQIEEKKKKLSEITQSDKVSIIESPELYGFRNKMEYSFEGENLGLHPRGCFDRVVDLKECPVFSEWTGGFLDAVREFASKHSLKYYERRRKNGILRHLILKESKFTGEKMVILVVDGNGFNLEDELVSMVRESIPEVAVIILARRHLSGDSAQTDDYSVIYGKEYIEMKIGKYNMNVSAYSFCQPNSYQIENMYGLLSDGINGECSILDLFCGVGSIGLNLAEAGRSVTGVELYPSCIKNAKENLNKINPSGKIEFVESKVKTFVSSMRDPYDYIILDPPRGGMSYKIWKHLIKYQNTYKCVKKVFFVCCSLKNLQEDLNYIRENSAWEVENITGFDQFVHTPHLETIVEIIPRLESSKH